MAKGHTAQALHRTISVDTSTYLGIEKPERIREHLTINLSEHSFLPRIDDLQSDWVAHVAAPAFKAYRTQRDEHPVESFCSIGTGSGLDVLSAIELLGASRVGLTDVHEDVVAAAVSNVQRNHHLGQDVTIEAGFGDLLTPLSPYRAKYDVIYENLPNIPSSSTAVVASDRKSSDYVPPRIEQVPSLVKQQMLDLHYLALMQAKSYLHHGGAVLSCLGARVPLGVFLELSEAAGYQPSFLIYGWKVQGDPELIRDYATNEQSGFGPFYFYRAETLQSTFLGLNPVDAGANALEIERTLQTHRLDPAAAYAAFQCGERMAHTVVVLKSESIS
ncbi:MAG TPA: hypothetical protein VM578_13365 [Candidatus Saccharimonadales bacterium]|nr:hypothetical protein [Candidatus Saccharimonadales bacterium]